ncbi:MAG: ABC transporter permease [Planctomycetota bacterium]
MSISPSHADVSLDDSSRLGGFAPQHGGTLYDLRKSLAMHGVWRFLAWKEIARQYHRTVLGVVWLPLSVAIHVLTLGYIFSRLFGGDRYLPWFALGYSIWRTVSRAAGEAADLWFSSEKYLRHLAVPMHTFIFKLVLKCGYSALLTVPVGLAIAINAGARPGVVGFLAIPGFVLLLLNLWWMITVFSLLCLRFPDLGKFMPNLITLAYLGSPIMWQPERLGDRRWIADYNPFFHLIELVRAPLLGSPPTETTLLVAGGFALAGHAAALVLFRMARRRIVLWL